MAAIQSQSIPVASVPNFNFNSNVIEIHPSNDHALLAFDELTRSLPHVQRGLLGNAFVTHEANLSSVIGGNEDSGTDSSMPSGQPKQPTKIKVGYFRIRFRHNPLSNHALWTLGRAQPLNPSTATDASPHAKVDIVLAIAGSRQAKRLYDVHAYLRLHPQSGAWMFSTFEDCPHIKSHVGADIDTSRCNHNVASLDDKNLRHGEVACLSKPSMALKIGLLCYRIRFGITTTGQEGQYKQIRRGFLKGVQVDPPPTPISGIPFSEDTFREDLVVYREPYYNGTFGIVYLGFHPRNGHMRAVKVWNLKKNDTCAPVLKEIRRHEWFTQKGHREGIVETFGWFNSLGQTVLTNTDNLKMPINYAMVMEQGKSFDKAWNPLIYLSKDYEKHNPGYSKVQKELLRQLLVGLQSIHHYNYIHGDITPQNIIYCPSYPGSPAKAKIIDFGKMQRGPIGTDWVLAAKIFLAPEVRQSASFGTNIDIWGLALTIAIVWFHGSIRDMDPVIYAGIISKLKSAGDRIDFAPLLISMLSEDPQDRPSATECLAHACFKSDGLGLDQTSLVPTTFTKDGKRERP